MEILKKAKSRISFALLKPNYLTGAFNIPYDLAAFSV